MRVTAKGWFKNENRNFLNRECRSQYVVKEWKFIVILPPITSVREGVKRPLLFVRPPRLSLRVKLACIEQWQAFNSSKNIQSCFQAASIEQWQAFNSSNNIQSCFQAGAINDELATFCTIQLDILQILKHVCRKKFAPNFEDPTCLFITLIRL